MDATGILPVPGGTNGETPVARAAVSLPHRYFVSQTLRLEQSLTIESTRQDE
jgi:hypothetical protein